MEKNLGPTHPSLNTVLSSLAANQRKLGYAANAKAYLERAIAILEAAESPPLGKLADNYGALGTLIMDEGFLNEAEPLIRRALILNKEVYGDGNAANTYRLLHLGILFRKREDFDQAREYLGQAIDSAKRRYPDTHREVQIMRLHLAVAEANAGNREQAADTLDDILLTLETELGPKHSLVGQTLLELSVVEIALNRLESADRHLVRGLDIYRALRDEWHPDIEWGLRHRADLQSKMGNTEVEAQLIAEADRLKAGRQKISEEAAKQTQQAEF